MTMEQNKKRAVMQVLDAPESVLDAVLEKMVHPQFGPDRLWILNCCLAHAPVLDEMQRRCNEYMILHGDSRQEPPRGVIRT